MEHKEFNRIVDYGNTAILFIHGVVGTPNYFNDFIAYIPDNWSISNLLLDGHGKGVDEFAKASMRKWKEQVSEKVNELLATHKNIIIMGHSMGTLFAIEQGIKHPSNIKALILLASPLRVFIRPQMAINIIRIFVKNVNSRNRMTIAVCNAYGIKVDKRMWKYIKWLPRYFELLVEIKSTRKQIHMLQVPCYAFQSAKDEIVSMSACKVLETNKNIHTTVLKKSRHFYYNEDDYELITKKLKELIVCYSN